MSVRTTTTRRITPRSVTRSPTTLFRSSTFSVSNVVCQAPRSSWSSIENTSRFALVLPRSGRYHRRSDGETHLADPMTPYFELPGQEQLIAHPCDGGDTCTVLSLSVEFVSWMCDPGDLPRGPLITTPNLALHHRFMLQCSRADAAAVTDHAIDIVGEAFQAARATDQGGLAITPHRRLVVARAREALADDPTLSLPQLAQLVGTSPHHLSRVFKSVVGCSITTFRQRLRLNLVIDRLIQGDSDLASLAISTGFSDHAHLSREVRRHLGRTPSKLRELLSRGPSGNTRKDLQALRP